MKKLFLALLIIFSFNIPGYSQLVTIGSLEYYLWGGAAQVRGAIEGPIHNLEIPDVITYKDIDYNVTQISSGAFENREDLTGTLTIGKNVVTVRWNALLKSGFSSVVLHKSFSDKNILHEGLYHNSISTIFIPEDNPYFRVVDDIIYNKEITKAIFCPRGKMGHVDIAPTVTEIETRAFRSCRALETVVIGGGLEIIRSEAFQYCSSLTALSLPASVVEIGAHAFAYCESLLSFVIPDKVLEIQPYTFSYCYKLSTVTMGNMVEKIGPQSFFFCRSLTTISLPESVVEIGVQAFAYCESLLSFVIPDKVLEIQSHTFDRCSKLATLMMGEFVERIGSKAFGACSSLTSLHIPKSVSEIGESAFNGCSKLESFKIPDKVLEIPNFTFAGCTSLSTITIGESVERIRHGAFLECNSLVSIRLPASLISLGEAAFEDCRNLQDVYFEGENLDFISDNAFSGTSISCVVLPNSVTYLSGEAFAGSPVKSILLGTSLDFIYVYSTFWNLYDFTEVIILAPFPPVFHDGVGTTVPVYVPDASYEDYLKEDTWGSTNLKTLSAYFTPKAQPVDVGFGELFEYEFTTNAESCVEIRIPSLPAWLYYQSVEDGEGNIVHTLSGTAPSTPESVTLDISACLQGKCFASHAVDFEVTNATGCTGNQLIDGIHYQLNEDNTATVIALPNDEKYSGHIVVPPTVKCGGQEYTVTTIGFRSFGDYVAFGENPQLLSIELPNTIISIESYAFGSCSNLSTILLPESLMYIGEDAFQGCGFTEVTIPENVETIGRGAFEDCKDLEYVAFLGNKILDLKKWTFGLTSISCFVVPNSLVSIDGGAIRGAPLKSVMLGESLAEIYGYELFLDNNPTEIILLSPTPPSVSGFGFEVSVPIYVPDASYEAYLMDDAWGLTNIKTLSAYFTPKALPVDVNVEELFEYEFTTNANSCVEISIPNLPTWLSVESVDDGNGNIVHTLAGTAPSTPGSVTLEISACLQGNCFASHTVEFEVTNAPGCTGNQLIDGIHYQLNEDNTATVIALPDNEKYSGHVALPPNVDCGGQTYSVTEIGDYAFSQCTGLLSVSFPASILEIGQSAFGDCTGLTTLTLPGFVESIGYGAFSGCSQLACITVPASVVNLGGSVFTNMGSLTEVIFLSSAPATIAGTNPIIEISKPIYLPDASLAAYEAAWGSNHNVQPYSAILLDATIDEIEINQEFSYNFSTAVSGCIDFVATGLPIWLNMNPSTGILSGSPEEEDAGLYDFTITASQDGQSLATRIAQIEVINSTPGCTGNQLIDDIHYQLNEDNTATVIALPNDEKYSGHVALPPTVDCGGQTYSVTEIGDYAFSQCSGLLSVSFPASILEIGQSAFSNCTGLTTLSLPGFIESIGYGAFSGCSQLACITVPASVVNLGGSVFINMGSLTEVIFLSSAPATIIGTNPILEISKPIYLPDVSLAAYEAAWGSNHNVQPYSAILLDATVDEIEINQEFSYNFSTAVSGCIDFVATGLPSWLSMNPSTGIISGSPEEDDAGLHDFTITASQDGQSLSTRTVQIEVINSTPGCTGNQIINGIHYQFNEDNTATVIAKSGGRYSGHLVIPPTVECGGQTYTVTAIGDNMSGGTANYPNRGLWSIVLPNTITHIGNNAFGYCTALKGPLNLPNSLLTIGRNAFYSCVSLNGSLVIPNSVVSIGSSAFRDCRGFTGSLTIGSSVSTIGDFAFRDCSGFTGSLTIPNSVTTIGNYAFINCSSFNGSLILGSSVTFIGGYAFSNCSGLTGSLTIPNSVTTIGWYAFSDCSGFTGSLSLGYSTSIIDDSAFSGCSGFSGLLSFPGSVAVIGRHAFKECNGLTCVVFPNSVGTIGSEAFHRSDNLQALFFLHPEPPTNLYGILEGYKSIYVPDVSLSSYQSVYNRVVPLSSIINESPISEINTAETYSHHFKGILDGCISFVVTGLPSWLSLDNSTGLITGTTLIPSSYEYEITAYLEDEELTSRTIRFEVIDRATGCTGNHIIDGIHYQLNEDNTATVIALPNYERYSGVITVPAIVECGWKNYIVREIGHSAFSLSFGLTGINLPETLLRIEDYAFDGCSGLTEVILPEGLLEIGRASFIGCSNLTSIRLPASLTDLGAEAFYRCSKLQNVYFEGENLTRINSETFKNTDISCIVFPNSIEYLEGNVFGNKSLQSLTLGSSLNEINGGILLVSNEIVCLAPTPPKTTLLISSRDIFVPDAYYDNYLMDEVWGGYSIKMLSSYITPKALPVDVGVGELFEFEFTTNSNSCVDIRIPNLPDWLSLDVDRYNNYILSGVAPETPGFYSFIMSACMQDNCFASYQVEFEVVENPCVVNPPKVSISREYEGSSIICPNGSIRLVANARGGHQEHYTYKWYSNLNVLLKEGSENFIDIDFVTHSKLGTYRVQLVDSNTRCIGNASHELTSYLFFTMPEISVTALKATSCTNSSDGEAFVSGIYRGHSFSISHNGQPLETDWNGEAKRFTNLRKGHYVIRGITNDGCDFSKSFTISNGGPVFRNVCTHLLPVNLKKGQVASTEVSFMVNRAREIASNTYQYNIVNSLGEKVLGQDGTASYGIPATAVFDYVHGETYTIQIYESGVQCDETSYPLAFSKLAPHLTAKSEVHRCFEGQNVTFIGHVSLNFNNCTSPNLNYTIELLREVNGEFIEPVLVNSHFDLQNNIVIRSSTDVHAAGRYLLRFSITDAYYGQIRQEQIMEVIENAMIEVNVEAFDVACPGDYDGRLEASVSGGVPPYRYYWFNEDGEQVSTNTSVATMLNPGNYMLKITDSRDCDMEESFGPYTVYDKEPWGDITVELPHSLSDNCSVVAEISGVESGMTYTFEWIRISQRRLLKFFDSQILKDENYTRLSSVVWTEKVKVAEGSDIAVSISDSYYVEPGHEYYLIIRDENGCMVNSLDQLAPLHQGHVSQTPFKLEPFDVVRDYNLVFAWKSRVKEVEEEVPPVIAENTRAAIAASSIAQEMMQQALECAAIAGKVAEATFEDLCLSTENLKDELVLEYENGSYHYTLYYFDRAGNLIKTVPPKGVNLYTGGDSWPGHSMVTEYRYNSLGQLIWQNTPDGGQTRFLYNSAGQLRFSQNAQQAIDNAFSYTKYDELGRVRETGEGDFSHADIPYSNWLALTSDADNIFAADLQAPLAERFPQASITEPALHERTFTWYGQKSGIMCRGKEQRYLLNRVSHTSHTNENGETITTYFSYDPHGNVEWMMQELPMLGQSFIEYDYDLVSGNVTQVAFNRGSSDQFFHSYLYDEDNRIKEARTSDNGIVWESDARYSYYKHGPLKRMEMGKDKVQGLDYIYTIQGWLKAINHPALTSAVDPGNDGGINTAGSDAFGMILTYFEGDFRNENSVFNNKYIAPETSEDSPPVPPDRLFSSGFEVPALDYRDLYNGNISSWTHSTATSNTDGSLNNGALFGQQFVYDKLNRIKESRFSSMVGNSWQATDHFNSSYAYDANGNITHLNRTSNQGSAAMDDLTYHYPDGTNKLDHVSDVVPEGLFENDINDQQDGNYQYDAIGNLVSDAGENISNIEWTVQGKVASIIKSDNSHITFSYDAFGNRVGKTVTLPGGLVTTTYYVRDAQGNVMSVYNGTQESASGGASGHDHVITLLEQPIYGSSRLGMRLGNGLEVRRINIPLTGNPEVVFDGAYSFLGQLISANISSQGALITDGKALPGISATLKALTPETYSISLITENANSYGDLEFDLLQNNTQSIWSGKAASTGTWTHTITAGTETSNYQLSVRQKSSIFDQPIARHIHGKQYELTDHLGNVRAVIGSGLTSDGGPSINPRVIATNTYYPFGMLIAPLSTNSEGYRYGFNGKEKDDEWTGVSGSHLDFGARIYDSRIGRWLSTDPLEAKYPGLSPYNFAMNTPISAVDPDGNLVMFIGGLRLTTGVSDQRMPVIGYTGDPEPGIYKHGAYDGSLRKYWNNEGKPNSFGRDVDMAQLFMNRIGDQNAYYLSGSSNWTSQASQRYSEGEAKAERFHAMVLNGKIELADDETIKIVSHSQGGAHAEGFAQKLLSYKDADGNSIYNIEVIYNITPHQPGDMSHINGIRGVQYSHPDDAVSSRSILPNGGSKLAPMKGNGEYVESQELVRKGIGGLGNRGQHNVTDNDQIFDIPAGQGGYVAPRKDTP